MSLATEPVDLRSRSERLRAPLASVVALGAATAALHVRDPHVHGSWGLCPLYATTGIYCPGCGGLRGVNDLTDGHVGQALSSNLLLVLAVPFAVFVLARWGRAAWTGRSVTLVPELPRAAQTALILLVVVFTVARNLPGSWLAP
jgi:Protein of unknown function (DUF2752)